MQTYVLYNFETERAEFSQVMTEREVKDRNYILRANGEPQRWVPKRADLDRLSEYGQLFLL